MDVERALLARVINDQSLPLAIKARITPEFFRDDVYRRIYEFLLDHWSRYSQAPDLAVVNRSFPSYDWSPQPHSLDYLIDAMRERREYTIAVTALNECATLLNATDDPERTTKIVDLMASAAMQCRVETTSAIEENITEYTDQIMDLIREIADNPGMLRGITTGFVGIDYATGGWQPDQFVVLMGLPKSLKSSVMLYMALHAHKQAMKTLFLGFEMKNSEQYLRATSLLAKVSLTKILTGRMNAVETRKCQRALNELKGMRDFLFSEDITNGLTVSGVKAKILDYNPDIVFIDAAYLMQSEIPGIDTTSPAAMTDVARKLKQLAQQVRIPIVVSVQASATRASGGKLNAGSAMYTQAWRQSADVLLGSERASTDEEVLANDGAVGILIKVLASRSGPYAESAILWDWNHGYVDESIAVGSMPAQDDAH
jgi:replicative DNA helicase